MYKITAVSNWPVNADPDDSAAWGRLVYLQFPHSHLGREDMGLKERFRTPEFLEGVLAWAVEGAIQWYATGLTVPPIARHGKQEALNSVDTIGQFLNECCSPEGDVWTLGNVDTDYVTTTTLHIIYSAYCKLNGISPKGGVEFNKSLAKRGMIPNVQKKVEGKNNRVTKGLRVYNSPDIPDYMLK